MPVILPNGLPAAQILRTEGRSVFSANKGSYLNFDHLKVGLLNLMPDKKTTETQFARLLGSTPYPVEMRLFRLVDQPSKNCCPLHMSKHYRSFERRFAKDLDALIITGAPVEHLDFNDVTYWDTLKEAMDLASQHIPETLGICWGAMALAYHHHGLEKVARTSKAFGCVEHRIHPRSSPLLFGMEDGCKIPVSRWTSLLQSDIDARPGLRTLMTGSIGGPCVIRDDVQHVTYFLNHLEYDSDTLAKEYERDRDKGIQIALPVSYFPLDDVSSEAPNVWFGSAKIFYANWLNLVHSKKQNPSRKSIVTRRATFASSRYNTAPNPREIGIVF